MKWQRRSAALLLMFSADAAIKIVDLKDIYLHAGHLTIITD